MSNSPSIDNGTVYSIEALPCHVFLGFIILQAGHTTCPCVMTLVDAQVASATPGVCSIPTMYTNKHYSIRRLGVSPPHTLATCGGWCYIICGTLVPRALKIDLVTGLRSS